MKNLLSFEIIDLSELSEDGPIASSTNGCGRSNGSCSGGCGCGWRNGNCGMKEQLMDY